jgi:hypothetical protein
VARFLNSNSALRRLSECHFSACPEQIRNGGFSPVNEDKGTYAERNTAKRLENKAIRLKRGYLRGTLLPTVTWTAAFIICVYSLRHFIFDATKDPVDRAASSDAKRNHSDGNSAPADDPAAKILAEQPNHSPAEQPNDGLASQLMARVGALFTGEAADRKACMKQVSQLAALIGNFAESHNGSFPKSFDELLAAQKTPDATLLVAPLATDKSKPSYELLLADKRLSSITNPAQTIAIRSLYTFKDGGYLAAFADGHVEILDGKTVNPEQAPH